MNLSKILPANTGVASFPALAVSASIPSGDGIVGGQGAEAFRFAFYGVGSDNNQGAARVYGWSSVGAQWFYTLLAEVTFDLSTVVGIAANPILNTERLADTITEVSGETVITNSAPNLGLALVEVPTLGFDLIQVVFQKGTATSVNGLYGRV